MENKLLKKFLNNVLDRMLKDALKECLTKKLLDTFPIVLVSQCKTDFLLLAGQKIPCFSQTISLKMLEEVLAEYNFEKEIENFFQSSNSYF